jgi:hypothetical protein
MGCIAIVDIGNTLQVNRGEAGVSDVMLVAANAGWNNEDVFRRFAAAPGHGSSSSVRQGVTALPDLRGMGAADTWASAGPIRRRVSQSANRNTFAKGNIWLI